MLLSLKYLHTARNTTSLTILGFLYFPYGVLNYPELFTLNKPL